MTSKSTDIPTESENKKLEDLFLAIYFNDLESVIKFKKQYPDIYVKKDNFLINDEKYLIDNKKILDLINLTFFNKTIWFDKDWHEDFLPLVEKQRQKIDKMINYWRIEKGIQEIQRQIEYNDYHGFFYCDDPSDFDEVLLSSMKSYIREGFREIDLLLYNRVDRFDFKEVEKLLIKGANMDILIDSKDSFSSSYLRIVLEISFLKHEYIIPEFKRFEIHGYNQDFDIEFMFGHLIGLAAHLDMYYLLSEFKNNSE